MLQDLDLPSLFASMEDARAAMIVEEYSISQTTLEHVFIALAAGEAGAEPAEGTEIGSQHENAS
jgi:hypothetical protein